MGVSEWSGAARGLNCVPPAKKKGIRSGLPLLLRIMGLRVHFPLRLSPRPHPEETATEVVLPRIEPGPNDDLLLGAACGPSCSPKDQQLYSLSFVFQPKTTREQTNVPTQWPRGPRTNYRDSGTGLPVRTLQHQPTTI